MVLFIWACYGAVLHPSVLLRAFRKAIHVRTDELIPRLPWMIDGRRNAPASLCPFGRG